MWLVFCLLCAGATSGKDALSKRSSQDIDPWVAAIVSRFVSAGYLTAAAILIHGVPSFSADVLLPFTTTVLLNALASVLYFRGLSKTDLTLALPLLNLSPVFLLATTPLITGEGVGWLGGAGLVTSVAGTYFLHFGERKRGFLEPFKRLARDSGSRTMLVIAAVWSVTSPLDRLAVDGMGPLWFAASAHFSISLLLYVVFAVQRKRFAGLNLMLERLIPIGAFEATAFGFQSLAYPLAPVPYTIGMKRLSILLGAIWGRVFFQERENFHGRLAGILLMLTGLALIAISMA